MFILTNPIIYNIDIHHFLQKCFIVCILNITRMSKQYVDYLSRLLTRSITFLFLSLNNWRKINSYQNLQISYNNFFRIQQTVKLQDGKFTCIYKLLISHLLISLTVIRFGHLYVKTGLCHILQRLSDGVLKRHTSAYGFWYKMCPLEKARKDTAVLQRNIVLK
jgi:hypothetical protein